MFIRSFVFRNIHEKWCSPESVFLQTCLLIMLFLENLESEYFKIVLFRIHQTLVLGIFCSSLFRWILISSLFSQFNISTIFYKQLDYREHILGLYCSGAFFSKQRCSRTPFSQNLTLYASGHYIEYVWLPYVLVELIPLAHSDILIIYTCS